MEQKPVSGGRRSTWSSEPKKIEKIHIILNDSMVMACLVVPSNMMSAVLWFHTAVPFTVPKFETFDNFRSIKNGCRNGAFSTAMIVYKKIVFLLISSFVDILLF